MAKAKQKKQKPIPFVSYTKTYEAGPGSAMPPTPEIIDAYAHADGKLTVSSKGVDRAAYDSLTETMFITWITGATYAYVDVPADLWEGWQNAESKGKFANFAVKFHHKCYGPLPE